MTPTGGTLRLTTAQAITRYLLAQFTRIDGAETRICGGGFGIFGHGNVPCLGEAKLALPLLGRALGSYTAPAAWTTRAQEDRRKWDAYVAQNVSHGDRPNSYAQAIGVVNALCHPRDRVVTAAGGLPAEVTANWRTLDIGTVDVEPEADTIVFIGNDVEFGFMAGKYAKGLDKARALVAEGATLAVYKMGEKGAITITRDAEITTGIFPTTALKPTGAGDSFMGGLVAGLADGLPVRAAVLQGSANATRCPRRLRPRHAHARGTRRFPATPRRPQRRLTGSAHAYRPFRQPEPAHRGHQ